MRLLPLVVLSLTLSTAGLLSGCSGFNDAAPLPLSSSRISPGPIKGSNFGGHAPIAGAHLFVLTASETAYGGQSSSGITAGIAGASYDWTGGSAGTNPTYGDSFITTQADGSFNIIGDYGCSLGDPVYLYAQGGSTTGAAPSTATVTGLLAAASSVSGFQTVTVTTSTPVTLLAGAPVTFSGFTNASGFPSTASYAATVVSTQGAKTTFQVTVPTTATNSAAPGYVNGMSYSPSNFGGGATVTYFPTANPQIVNTAMLGLCPQTSGEFANTLQYVYINEISTVAMAEAMAGFASTSTTGLTTDAVHIGAPSTNVLGLQIAAQNANQLFDIQGGNVGTGSNGEAHIARAVTPNGNGNVPQTLLDTLGNILAACIDSANTYNPYTQQGTQSALCATLFENASATGILLNSGTATGSAPDSATAAFNMAHFPAGQVSGSTVNNPLYNTTFVTNLYGMLATAFTSSSGSSSAPFSPQLTAAPNDFSVAIQYPLSNGLNPQANEPESIAIDGNGNIWMNSAGNNQVFEYNPMGVLEYKSPSGNSYSYGYLSVDPGGNVWSGSDFANSQETEFQVSNAATYSYTPVCYPNLTCLASIGGYYDGYVTVTDSSGNAYVSAALPTAETQWLLTQLSSSGTPTTVASAPFAVNQNVAHGTIDAAGYVWLATEGTTQAIGRFSETSGTAAFANLSSSTANGGVVNPAAIAIDSSNNAWIPQQHSKNSTGTLMRVTPTGTTTTYTGGTQGNPFGVMVDGLNHVWVANRCSTNCVTSGTAGPYSSLLEFDSTGVALSPKLNYTLNGQISHPLNVAIDASGVIWATCYDSSMIVEAFGMAAPTKTPLSVASSSSNPKLGVRP